MNADNGADGQVRVDERRTVERVRHDVILAGGRLEGNDVIQFLRTVRLYEPRVLELVLEDDVGALVESELLVAVDVPQACELAVGFVDLRRERCTFP